MKSIFLFSTIFLSILFAQAQTETITLQVGDKFEVLGVSGKLFEVYGPSKRDKCGKSDKGKMLVASVAYVEFKYNKKKVSVELCNQQVEVAEGKPTETFYTAQKFKGKDAVVSLALKEVKESKKQNLIVLEISKEPLPVE